MQSRPCDVEFNAGNAATSHPQCQRDCCRRCIFPDRENSPDSASCTEWQVLASGVQGNYWRRRGISEAWRGRVFSLPAQDRLSGDPRRGLVQASCRHDCKRCGACQPLLVIIASCRAAACCGMLAVRPMDGVMSAMWRFTGHQNNIADIERLLREAEWGRNPAGVHRMVRRAIFRSLASEPFREFIRTTEKADGCHWPVATISAERARELGLQERAGVLWLTSGSVVTATIDQLPDGRHGTAMSGKKFNT